MKQIVWIPWKEYWDDINPAMPEIDGEELLIEKPAGLVMTPMGPYPVLGNSHPEKVFNLWVGHANFDIIHTFHDEIEQISGVEVLEIMSRYRMKVGIAKLFDEDVVLKAIDGIVQKVVTNPLQKILQQYKLNVANYDKTRTN